MGRSGSLFVLGSQRLTTDLLGFVIVLLRRVGVSLHVPAIEAAKIITQRTGWCCHKFQEA